MAGWPRIVRAMLGTGVTFAAGVGVVGLTVGVVAVLAGAASLHDLRMVGRVCVVAFLLGVAFSGMLAFTARSRRMAALSIPRFAALGAGAGLLYFGLLALNAASRWSLGDAVANLVILTLLGGGGAIGTLLLARRGRPGLTSGEESRVLGAGHTVDGDMIGGGVAAGRDRTTLGELTAVEAPPARRRG